MSSYFGPVYSPRQRRPQMHLRRRRYGTRRSAHPPAMGPSGLQTRVRDLSALSKTRKLVGISGSEIHVPLPRRGELRISYERGQR